MYSLFRTTYNTGASACVTGTLPPGSDDSTNIIGGVALCFVDSRNSNAGKFCLPYIDGYAWHVCKVSAYCTGDGYLRSCPAGT